MLTTKSNLTRTALIAPCGIDCRLCMAYVRDKNVCPGCRGDNTFKSKSCVNCKIKNCEKLAAGGFKYCFECDEFPCERVAHLDWRYRTKYATSPIENLASIKTGGVRKFVKNEDTKWACPQCGSMLCMHKPQCISCGYTWHK